jgi:signal transduction histidine kinase
MSPVVDNRDRRRALSAAAVAVLVALAVAGSIAAAAVDRSDHTQYVNEVVAAVGIGLTAVVGATVALAIPRNVIGWLILLMAAFGGVAEALVEPGVRHIHDSGAAPYLVTFGVIARALPSVLGNAAVPAYFPDGRLPGPRWRWVRWTLIAAVAATVVGGFVAPIETRLGEHWHGPFTPAGKLGENLQIIDVLGVLLTVVAGVAALVGLVVRWRRGGPIVRQQLLLFACAVLVAVLFLIGVLVYVSVSNGDTPRFVFTLASLPLPVAVAVATLNHGLYDLRRAANRTVLWLLVIVSLTALYVAVVLVAAALSPDRRAWWPPALAAAVAALALVPLRDRLQRFVRRVVYGRWHEPYEVLTGLAARLEGAAADLDALLESVTAELAGELDLRDVSVRDGAGRLVAGAQNEGAESVALHAYGVRVGELRYAAHDRQLSAAEERLVRDLARQLGATLHARALTGDLQRAREKLVLAREEERRRLRRDLHDGIGPALAGLTLKAEAARALLPRGADLAAHQLRDLSDEIRATVVDVRRVVEGLRPPALDELGLDGACRQAVDRLTRASGVSPTVSASGDLSRLPAAVEVAAFRIVLEAVTNVVRHADARTCCVSLAASDGTLDVVVEDDGRGLADGPARGNGMATMRERAEELGGSVSVCATAHGVRVHASLPARATTAGAGSA